MLKVGVVGASGYSGGELLRLLARHPKVKIEAVSSRSNIGQSLAEVTPALALPDLELRFVAPEQMDNCDLVFLAVPHGVASKMAGGLLNAGQKVVDIGADFRIKDLSVYAKWYQQQHGAPELIDQAVYGLPEIHRDKIKNANLIGNPGCYPTSVILALAPLLQAGAADCGTIIINSLSGVSGAGRGLGDLYHYSHCEGNLVAYGVGSHRHVPEIEQELSSLAGAEVKVSFTPHLVPTVRGILTTITLGVKQVNSTNELVDLYREFYKNEYFVRIQPPGRLPQTKHVLGSNFCDIGVVYDPRVKRAVVVSAIDNLGKGAASQAVQNMNIMAGWSEQLGIDYPALYP
ncbi:MAG: N-acetyl-gamma-glutamyl-phosphate reductase [Firmicutes bacterium]|nr:N-acetyl-gamma-glutamyl-phosphate reductase [Bacillota bacterium]